jgi:hypothetical protein
MKLQPGVGYTFDSSSRGFTLDTSDPFPEANKPFYQQFECMVVGETTGGTTKYFLKTRKGVVDYTWTQFPFRPEESPPGNGIGDQYFKASYQKQARITDWAVYENGKRTAGTTTDGDEFNWMANNGKIELPAGASGASMLVLISKIDWWDRDGWLVDYRLIEPEMPFVSVIPTSDATAMNTLAVQQGSSLTTGPFFYVQSGAIEVGGPVPIVIGYTYKKIAQLDWNDTTEQWDVTQYEYGPITLPMHCEFGYPTVSPGPLPSPSQYEIAVTNEFSGALNYAWFEATWSIPGYTLNPDDWWYHLVNN